MQLEFADPGMRRLAEELDYQPPAWGDGVARTYRKMMQLVTAAKDVADLRALRSVGIAEYAGADGEPEARVPLGKHEDLILKFPAGQANPIAIVVGVVNSPSEGTGNE